MKHANLTCHDGSADKDFLKEKGHRMAQCHVAGLLNHEAAYSTLRATFTKLGSKTSYLLSSGFPTHCSNKTFNITGRVHATLEISLSRAETNTTFVFTCQTNE